MKDFFVVEIESLVKEKIYTKLLSTIFHQVHDVYYNIHYLLADRFCERGNCYIAILNSDIGQVIYPFILQPIPKYLEFNEIQNYYDIITPYEFGGPLIIAEKSFDTVSLTDSFDSNFKEYCKNNRIICESIRFNPILQNHIKWQKTYDITKVNENVIVNLNQTEEEILADYHKNKRRDINAAKRSGIVINKSADKNDLRIFIDIYNKTMDRKNASSFYYFSEKYFYSLYDLKEIGLCSLYIATNQQNVPLSAAFFLHASEIVYYHLSGSEKIPGNSGAQHLLLHSAILDMKRNNYKYFHLGGAGRNQTGLYKFKSMYSSNRFDYFFGKRIHNYEFYNLLKNRFLELNCSSISNHKFLEDFFPIYRKPL